MPGWMTLTMLARADRGQHNDPMELIGPRYQRVEGSVAMKPVITPTAEVCPPSGTSQ